MKLKYKKIIILTAMSTMGIGFLTLSISHEGAASKASLTPKTSQEVQAKHETRDITSEVISITPTVSPSPTPSPSPIPYPVYNLEKKCKKEIKDLIKNYYAAKIDCNTKKINSMVTNSSKVISRKEIQNKTEFIEDYRKITCYVKRSIEKDNYIVYVYSEVKITGINTVAPGLAKFYVVKNNKGKYKIFTGEMNPELKKYYDDRNNDEDVQKLIKGTDLKSKRAKKKDGDLAKFWKQIDKAMKDNMTKSNEKNVKSSKK